MTGFTFPGMMLEPGWTAGNFNSPIPHLGPEPSHRMSFAILVSATAAQRRTPLRFTTPSRAAWASKWFRASEKGNPVTRARSAMTCAAKPG